MAYSVMDAIDDLKKAADEMLTHGKKGSPPDDSDKGKPK